MKTQSNGLGALALVVALFALVLSGWVFTHPMQGPRGDQGDSFVGSTGPAGKDGRNGVDGRDGAAGPQGERGEKGEPGKDAVAPPPVIIPQGSYIHHPKK